MPILRRSALIAMMCLMASAGTAWATEQGQQRRVARDVRQETRQDARQTKQDCRAADQKKNPNAGRISGRQSNKVESELGISNTEFQSVSAAFECDSIQRSHRAG
ncbi:hypothetical protein [Pseudomonas arsenicoxydans]|uniref:hypothetical protein n=1 Tax=Pseudomonas arsenicoxydans TaxID=702115 RepID=UPI001E4F750F|nr:hypothetical protein [Pseudomonas arsenicoxydans]